VKGETVVEGKMFVACMSNGSYVGGGMRLNPNADPCDGVLNAIFLTPPSAREISQAIPKLFNGELQSLPFVHSVSGDEMLVHTKQYQAFQADGIVLDITGPCQVTCMKHALQMIVPDYCL
jgi:diacylglycerol kinase family enzyme